MNSDLREAAKQCAERNWSKALEALSAVDSTEENHLDLAYLLGLCHARLGDWDEALLFLEQVVTASDEYMRVCQCRLALAYSYSMTGRNRLAEYELDRLIKAGFQSSQVFAALGHTSWTQGNSTSAAEWYAAALKLDPESSTALNGLGYILAQEGKDTAKALTCCRKAVDSSPNNPAYLDSLGWVYHVLGFDDEARKLIGRALSIAPSVREIREHAQSLNLDLPSLDEEIF